MKYGEVVRLMIVPFGLMEAARLEFTPDYVLIVNRLKKTYAKARYDEVSQLKKNNITFEKVQEACWNEYTKQTIDLSIDKVTLKIKVGKVTYNSSFDATTSISGSYQQITPTEMLNTITKM